MAHQGFNNRRYGLSLFLRRVVLFFCPFLLLLFAYLCADPFKVIWQYDNYYPGGMAGGVSLNPGYVATQTYLRYRSKQHYDSFIMGNSRSIYYSVTDWGLQLPVGSRCYHYDAAAESLLGIWQKLSFIESRGDSIRNLLLVVDSDLLSKTDCDHWHLCEAPPALTRYKNLLSFHWYNLKTFLTPRFLFAYTDYQFSHSLKPYMLENNLLTEDMFAYDPLTNECDFKPLEERIQSGSYYDDRHISVFDGCQYPDSTSPVVIHHPQQLLLDSIVSLTTRHHTFVQVIVSPLYNQIRLHPSDKSRLQTLFGIGNVFDFSGPNEWNKDYHNYYETSHYRPHVARAILDSIKKDL